MIFIEFLKLLIKCITDFYLFLPIDIRIINTEIYSLLIFNDIVINLYNNLMDSESKRWYSLFKEKLEEGNI